MKRFTVALGAIGALILGGCDNQPAYAPPPPPPPPVSYAGQVPPLIQLAERNGGHAGFDDGARDAYYHAGYGPRRDQNYADAPGYDYRLGPIHPYVDAYRAAYLRAYDRGFYGPPDVRRGDRR